MADYAQLPLFTPSAAATFSVLPSDAQSNNSLMHQDALTSV